MRTNGLRPVTNSRSADSLRFSEGKEAKKKAGDAKKCTKAGRGAESPSRVSPQTQEGEGYEKQLAERVANYLKTTFPEKMKEIEHHQLKDGFVPVSNDGHPQPQQRSAHSQSPDTLETGGRVRETHSSSSQSKAFMQSSMDGGLKGAVNSNTRPHAPSPNASQQGAKTVPAKKSPSSEKGSTAPMAKGADGGMYGQVPEIIQPQYPPMPYPPQYIHQPIPVSLGYPPGPMCVGCNHRPAMKGKRGFKQSSDASSSRCGSAGGIDRARSERSEASLRANLEQIIQSGAPIQTVIDKVIACCGAPGYSTAEASSASPKQDKDWKTLQSQKSAFTGSSASYDSYLQIRSGSSLPPSRTGGSVSSSSCDTGSSQGPKHAHTPVYLIYPSYQYTHVMPYNQLQPQP